MTNQMQQVGSLLSNKLTTAELANELRRSPETIIRWRRTRKGPPFLRVAGGRVLYDRQDVESWLATGRVGVQR